MERTEPGIPAGSVTPPGSATIEVAARALGDEMSRFSRLITAWKQRARDQGDNGGDRLLLARLVVGGPRRATDLAADTLLDLSTVSRQIRSLIDRGLVERRTDPEDRRGALLTASAEGVVAFQRFRDQRNQKLALVLESWSAEDRHQLTVLFGRLNDDLSAHHLEVFGGPVGATAPLPTAAAHQGETH